jgi:hypothetical protein
MRDWVLLLTAIIQLYTAWIIHRREKEKGTERKRGRRLR